MISPPDLPRPANIISETAHLSIHHPFSGMFVAVSSNGTTQKITPLQSGLDTAGYTGGKIRVITNEAWDSGVDWTFRDQAFGRMSGINPMYHANTMPLAPGWNDSYKHIPLRIDSHFGLGTGANNTLGLTADVNGGYQVRMGVGERVGLDFGPGDGTDDTYYIYRGCVSCKAKVVVGHGSPADDKAALPNDLSVTDHYRGWKSTDTCEITTGLVTWNDRYSKPLSASYDVPAPDFSNAADHIINSRYDDLSILPNSHNVCTDISYTINNKDNSKHDICVSSVDITQEPKTSFTFACTATTKTVTTVGGISGPPVTTSGTCDSKTRISTGSCSGERAVGTTTGYKISATCVGGPPESTPTKAPTTIHIGNSTHGTKSTTTYSYVLQNTSTTAGITAPCVVNTNTPYLDLNGAMTIQPGLNVYRQTIPATHNMVVIYDDAEVGGGSDENIQIYAHDGLGAEPAGPYEFHLYIRTPGILYDSHRHYGWLDSGRIYNATHLAAMGYTQTAALTHQGDGAGPYTPGNRLCHGDCFMGPEGISGAPAIRQVDVFETKNIPAGKGYIYDHLNRKWYNGVANQTMASSLYLTIPFAEDVKASIIRIYDSVGFDPTAQKPSPRMNPGGTIPACHIGQLYRIADFATNLDIKNGTSLKIPILPKMKYVAFIGNGDCYWYDITTLPSPLSSVSSGARHIPLANGTILSGDLTARHDGSVHVDIATDLTAIWQSEMQGLVGTGTGNVTWVVPPFQVNITAVARVNGNNGECGDARVYCSRDIVLNGTTHEHGQYVHGSHGIHGTPYADTHGYTFGGVIYGSGVYGPDNGRCYGLANIQADTGGIIVRSIPNISVTAGDTVTLSFEAKAIYPEVIGGDITNIPAGVCVVSQHIESAVLDVTMMTATMR